MNESTVECEVLEMQKCQDRLRCLEELTEFTTNCKNQLDELIETLGWTREKAQSQESIEVCPYDPNHRVPSRRMEKHKASCQLSKMGYSQEEQAEMLDPSVCYEKSNITCFTMDKHTQQQVILQARASAPPLRMEGLYSQGEFSKDPPDVPQNHKRATSDLTVADRLALYDHVTRVTSQQKEQAEASNNEDLYIDLVAKLKKGDDQNGPKSHLELMAEMRDYKRRRQSYRAKNVHITKKSYTEVVREVIEVHSGELARQWKDEQREVEKLGETKRNSHRRRSEDRRSPSTESRHSHVGPREGHRKSHRSTERSRAVSKEHSRAGSKELNRAGSKERSRAGSKERSRAGSKERSRAGSKERSRAGSKERSREPSQEHRQKESKKKRKRDSRSPDERHHDKKKKKKKKDDKEKEKEK
ncbi:U11/U12 small nuclear ribonucleoprotein 48 kDa protein [Hypomesus transpacificus]|uniref:U11/U12 small nuclear ribonucleoprotein 48 kDa protein n=1 Tax=Hypomesus transpacificus TaxID=137520 RepID=UPI001F0784D7|nr:U11/U12 small nuclear ribonucleoprotein 48 kDa protein [Hypomesus transpacificus]